METQHGCQGKNENCNFLITTLAIQKTNIQFYNYINVCQQVHIARKMYKM
jgi:hypothetical protein